MSRPDPAPRVAVFGAGAIGCLVGAALHAAGAVVSLIARGAHLEALRGNGLTLRTHDGGTVHLELSAREDPAAFGPQDLVIVALKAPALAGLAAQIGPLLGPDTAVCFLMNGVPWWYWHGHGGPRDGETIAELDPEGRLRVAVDPRRVIGGVVRCSARVTAPGRVEVTSPFRHIEIGEIDGRTRDRSQRLAAMLRSGGIPSDLSSDIRNAVWHKLISNLMDGPLAVLTLARSDVLFSNPVCCGIARRIGQEASRIADALGRQVSIDLDKIIELGAARVHLPSLAEDLRQGRPMELDAYLGVPLTWAGEFEVPTPTLCEIAELVRLRAG